MNGETRQRAEPLRAVSQEAFASRSSAPLIAPRTIARWLLVIVLAASVWFFHDFLVPVLAATVIAFATWPLHLSIQSRLGVGRLFSASLLVLVALLFLVIPLVLAAAYAVGEVRALADWASEANRVGAPVPDWIAGLPAVGPWLVERWDLHVGRPGAIGEWIELASGETIGNVYRGVLTVGSFAFDLLLALLFMLITLFVFYRDGHRIAAQLDAVGERILPRQWGRISRVVPRTISATVVGMTVIAAGEGVVLGTAYWIAGAPSPVTLGLISGCMALIPGGAPLMMSLVSGYLVASGSVIPGIALFLWGSLELFVVDKTIRPALVGGPIKLPFLPTFFGLVGGVKTMGIVGLFVGPVVMALLVAIWREWLYELRIAPEDPPPVE